MAVNASVGCKLYRGCSDEEGTFGQMVESWKEFSYEGALEKEKIGMEEENAWRTYAEMMGILAVGVLQERVVKRCVCLVLYEVLGMYLKTFWDDVRENERTVGPKCGPHEILLTCAANLTYTHDSNVISISNNRRALLEWVRYNREIVFRHIPECQMSSLLFYFKKAIESIQLAYVTSFCMGLNDRLK